MNNWDAIRAHYARINHLIEAAPRNEWACDPYLWDAGKNMISMTPIEENFWADCREADLILYPQYPACGYFIDFANPAARVGIECDGRAFHTDKARDAHRQGVLEDNGWTIYRIGGRECNENWDECSKKAPAGRLLADQIGELHNIKRREFERKGTRPVGLIAASILDRNKGVSA
jgi:very-short-patch-repair endonuclease